MKLFFHRGRVWVAAWALGTLIAASTQAFTTFIHEATSANTFLDATVIDHPLLNDQPNVRFAVTQVFNPQANIVGVQNNANVGVFYAGTGRWIIQNQDVAPMPVGAKFFVLLPNDQDDGILHVVTEGNSNSAGTTTDVEDATLNSNPNAVWIATWVSNPGGGSGSKYNAKPVVRYDATDEEWRVFAIDGTPIPVGGAFSLVGFVLSEARQTLEIPAVTIQTHQAAADNVSFSMTRIPNTKGRYDFVFVTQTVGPALGNYPIGVLYDFFQDQWAVYNLDDADMPVGSTYYVLRFKALFYDGFELGNTSGWSSTAR